MSGKLLNSILAAGALTAGTMFGTNELEAGNVKPVMQQQQATQSAAWVKELALPFIVHWEGKVLDDDGMHVLYDDDVTKTVKTRWDGQGRAGWN